MQRVRPLLLFLCWFLICGYRVSAQFGSSCKTPSQEIGRCESIYSCGILLDLVKTKDPEIKQYLTNSLCGRKGDEPLVCCGTRTPYSGEPETQASTLLPAKDKCGYQQVLDAIYRGNKTALEEFPWVALLGFSSAYRREPNFQCGGTLINKRYVLTAAHCLTNRTLVSVRLGEWDRKTIDDCIGTKNFRYCIRAVDMEVEEVKQHENYVYKKGGRELLNDIALIRLKEEVKFEDHIQPICLPENAEEKNNTGKRFWVSGWDTTDANTKKNSDVKLRISVPAVSRRQCQEKFDRNGGIRLTDMQLCAGGESNKNSWYGDIGGPLMTTRVDDPSQFYIEGIVSISTPHGTDLPAVYTRVSAYLDWIKRNIKP